MLVHGAAGGVGVACIQFAKARGATVIAVVSSEGKGEVARAAGADHAVLVEGFKDAAQGDHRGRGRRRRRRPRRRRPVHRLAALPRRRRPTRGRRLHRGRHPHRQGQPAAAEQHLGRRRRLGGVRLQAAGLHAPAVGRDGRRHRAGAPRPADQRDLPAGRGRVGDQRAGRAARHRQGDRPPAGALEAPWSSRTPAPGPGSRCCSCTGSRTGARAGTAWCRCSRRSGSSWAVDLPSHGDSPDLPGDYGGDIAPLADAVEAFCAAQGLDRPARRRELDGRPRRPRARGAGHGAVGDRALARRVLVAGRARCTPARSSAAPTPRWP